MQKKIFLGWQNFVMSSYWLGLVWCLLGFLVLSSRTESWEEYFGFIKSDLVPSLLSAQVAEVQCSTADPKLDVSKFQNVSLVNVKRYFT